MKVATEKDFPWDRFFLIKVFVVDTVMYLQASPPPWFFNVLDWVYINFGFNLLENFKVSPKLFRNILRNGKTWLRKMVTILRRNDMGGAVMLAEQIPFSCAAYRFLGHQANLGLLSVWVAWGSMEEGQDPWIGFPRYMKSTAFLRNISWAEMA